MTPRNFRGRLLATAVPLALVSAGAVQAQDASSRNDADVFAVEEVVITGLRGQPRTVTDSPVPVDVLSEEALERSSQTDTLNVLQTLVPSFQVPRAANTTSNTFVRSPTMRGLPADKTLMLLNGRRRHKSASVGVSGYGSQAADAAVIPSIALRSVEVLRDGAAAQYGSDAIAGVINFTLRDASQGGAFVAQAGQYYEGDGESVLIGGNIGLPLTDRGFLNLTAQWDQSRRTVRSEQFTSDAWNAVDAYETDPAFRAAVDLSEPLERVGRPQEEALRFVVNAGIDLSDESSVYAFGNYSTSEGIAAASYRVPGGGHQVMDNPIRLADGTEWRFKDMYPAGLRPLFSGEVTDWSAAAGWRTSRALSGGQTFDADISARYGWSKILYSMWDTVNASMGPDSPLYFTASNYVSNEAALNADFVYSMPASFTASPLVFNFGAEYRVDSFEIRPGEPNSYGSGVWATPDPFDFCTDEADFAARTARPGAPTGVGLNCASASDPVYNILQPGSNGITGLSPEESGEFSTDSHSLYAELTTDVVDGWFVDFAVRYENYESFGSTVIAKVATRYDLTDWVAIRGSVGTGFRAPTAGQLNMTQTQILTRGGVPLNTGLYPAHHPVAQFLGAEALRPEESVNYSIGFTFTPSSDLTLTIDAYSIEITDQIYATSLIDVTPDIRAAMEAAGVTGAGAIDQLNFFQNAIDTTVEGVDVVGSYRHLWSDGQTTSLTAALNFNTYTIDQVNIPGVVFNDVSMFNFENNRPEWRGNLTVSHDAGPFTAMVRANVFGPYARQTTRAGNAIQEYDTEVQIDAEVSVPVREGYTLTVGVRNLFDQYPDRNRIDPTNGRVYSDGPVDWQGGYYFARLNYTF